MGTTRPGRDEITIPTVKLSVPPETAERIWPQSTAVNHSVASKSCKLLGHDYNSDTVQSMDAWQVNST